MVTNHFLQVRDLDENAPFSIVRQRYGSGFLRIHDNRYKLKSCDILHAQSRVAPTSMLLFLVRVHSKRSMSITCSNAFTQRSLALSAGSWTISRIREASNLFQCHLVTMFEPMPFVHNGMLYSDYRSWVESSKKSVA